MLGSSLKSGQGVLLLSAVMVLTACCQSQTVVLGNSSGSRLPDAPSAFMGSDRQNTVPSRSSLSLLFDQASRSDVQFPSRFHWFSRQQKARTIRLAGLDDHPYLRGRAAWLTFAPTYIPANTGTVHSADDWQHYAHHIPVAGPVALRIGQKAQAHPYVATVFKIIQPQF